MPVSKRERTYAAMRLIREWVDYHYGQEWRLRPNSGELALGGADFDHLLDATVGEAYLIALSMGKSPSEAHREAVEAGNHCVHIWNTRTHKTRAYVSGNYELKRWDKAGESVADSLHLRFLNLSR